MHPPTSLLIKVVGCKYHGKVACNATSILIAILVKTDSDFVFCVSVFVFLDIDIERLCYPIGYANKKNKAIDGKDQRENAEYEGCDFVK
jgi:hypothetical protein